MHRDVAVPTQCVILAGGLGTRMLPMTERLPKALLPVAGRPFIDHQLEWLARHGVESVVVCIGHLGAQLRDHVGDGARWGLSARFADEGELLRGTAGALRVALEAGLLDQAFFVLYGDSFLPIDFAAVGRAFMSTRQAALMTVFRNDGRWDTSNVIYAAGKVLLYDKGHRTRPASEFHHIDYGLAVLSRQLISDRVPAQGRSDLAHLYFQLSNEGLLAGFEVSERFFEIGSPNGLADLERWLSEHHA